MSSASLLLVVFASLIHATWNLLAKRAAATGTPFVFAYTAVSFVLYAPWVGWQLLQTGLEPTFPTVACIVASGALHLAYSLCLQRGYRASDLSVVYPIARGSGPLLSSLGAIVVLGEKSSPNGLLGLVAVVLGIALIATRGRISAFLRPESRSGVWWGTLTGAWIAAYTVVDAYGVKTLGIPPVVLDWFANATRLAMLAPFMLGTPRTIRQAMKGRWGLACGVGALAPMAYILVLVALEMGAPLTFVAPAREMSMMVGVVFGMMFLHEPVDRWRTLGSAVLVAGVVLLGSA